MEDSRVASLICEVFFGDWVGVGIFCFWGEGGRIEVLSYGGDYGVVGFLSGEGELELLEDELNAMVVAFPLF